MDMIIQGAIAAATVLYLLSYLNFRRVFNYAFLVDAIVTGGFIFMFAGSYAGMMTGVIAGLIVSCCIRVGRATMGVEEPSIVRMQGELKPTVQWTHRKWGGQG
jgi:hypothetical protein